jgi:release factor glutamine methyltransferase
MPRETAAGLLQAGGAALRKAGLETAALDGRLLLQAAAKISREEIIADPDRFVADDEAERFWGYIDRRKAHEPVSKILGQREFYGRPFHVTRDVLDPRADTEALIDLCLSHVPRDRPIRILDLGSGSGAIAVTLLCELAEASGVAVDVSGAALEVTKRNAESLGVSSRLQTIASTWFQGVEGTYDLIVSNPPYIAAAEIATLPRDVRQYDPVLALDGGEDGLDCYRQIAAGASSFLRPSGFVAVEIGAGQKQDVAGVFGQYNFDLKAQQLDLAQHIRALLFTSNESLPLELEKRFESPGN